MSQFDPTFGIKPLKLTFEEYLKSVDFMKLPSDKQTNCLKLIQRVNTLLDEFGSDRPVNSGIRTPEDQIRIYKEKAAKKQKPFENGIFDQSKVPMGSEHLKAGAVDLSDADGKLDAFCTDEMLKKHDLYREHPDETPGWCHLQVNPPKSGNRTFNPYKP